MPSESGHNDPGHNESGHNDPGRNDQGRNDPGRNDPGDSEWGRHDPQGAPADLSHAGAVVDKAIEYMMEQRIGALSIASSLLGGAMGLLARSLSDEGVIKVLRNAIASVEAGDLRRGE